MGKRLKKLRKIRLHHEGNQTLIWGGLFLALLNVLLWLLFPKNSFGIIDSPVLHAIWIAVLTISIVVYAVVVNFFRCPIRKFEEDITGVVVAPADGKIVVIEEVEENEYFHERRLMVSIFMSLFNVHANWIPVEGTIKFVQHQEGNFHRAWLPKASIENERSTVVITTPEGTDILVRQVAGAMARRIVTYPTAGEECYIDDHMGFIKFGSRVDVFLPLGTEVLVQMGQRTVGNETVLAHLS